MMKKDRFDRAQSITRNVIFGKWPLVIVSADRNVPGFKKHRLKYRCIDRQIRVEVCSTIGYISFSFFLVEIPHDFLWYSFE